MSAPLNLRREAERLAVGLLALGLLYGLACMMGCADTRTISAATDLPPTDAALHGPEAPQLIALELQPVQTVLFDFDAAESAEEVRVPNTSFFPAVYVEGFADRRGDSAYNLALSRRRAEFVARALRRKGVPAAALDVRWQGEKNLACSSPHDCLTVEACHGHNRRVVISVYSGKKESSAP